MLIPCKLHNWLPFITLKAQFRKLGNRPLGLYSQPFFTRFLLPQAFPQDELLSLQSRKLKFLQYLLIWF